MKKVLLRFYPNRSKYAMVIFKGKRPLEDEPGENCNSVTEENPQDAILNLMKVC